MKFINKNRLRKTYAAFFICIPLLLTTALVKVDCPVCDGVGSVNNNVGMENVEITGVQATELGVVRNACGMFLMYNYAVTLEIENSGDETQTGWIVLYLIDYLAGKPLDTQYTVVEIPGKKSWEVFYKVWFLSGTDEPRRTEVKAEVFEGYVPCNSCDGRGKVSLNEWPIANALKDKFIQLQQIEKPWAPPEWPVDDENNY